MNIPHFLLVALLPFTAAAADSFRDWRAIEKNWESWTRISEPDLRKRAEGNDPLAKYFYFVNTVEEPSSDKARQERAHRFLVEAADAGVPHAVLRYAFDFRQGDKSKFFQGVQAAAATGFPPAQLELAEELLEGERAPVDEEQAVELVREAAGAGYPAAQFELAEMYACGLGDPRHPKETPLELYLAAAKRGSWQAASQLARRYRYGLGTERDLMEACRWLWRAEENSFSHRFSRLLDESNKPLPHLDPEASLFAHCLSLYVKARLDEDPEAMLKAGRAFLEGQYGKPNFPTAYIWLLRASRAGQASALALANQAKAHLTAAEISLVEQELRGE